MIGFTSSSKNLRLVYASVQKITFLWSQYLVHYLRQILQFILPDFFSGDGGVVPNLLGEFDTLLLLQDPGLPAGPGGVPILNCTGGEMSTKLTLLSEPWRMRLDSRISMS